jgi:hypothetical protein
MAFVMDDAQRVLQLVRNLYKGQFKSSNKMYVDVSTPKKLYRNLNAQAADQYLNQHRDQRAQKGLQSPRAYGEYLVDAPSKAGNCIEMSALACYYASLISDSVTIYEAHAGLHSFAILIDENADFDDDANTVSKMREARMQGVFIVDPWMNIACTANDYLERSFQKLMQWQTQGKTIRDSIVDGPDGAPLPVGVDLRNWHRTLAHAELEYAES